MFINETEPLTFDKKALWLTIHVDHVKLDLNFVRRKHIRNHHNLNFSIAKIKAGLTYYLIKACHSLQNQLW